MASSKAEIQQFTPPPYEEPPRQRGCFFYGCVIASILSLFVPDRRYLVSFFSSTAGPGDLNEYTGTGVP